MNPSTPQSPPTGPDGADRPDLNGMRCARFVSIASLVVAGSACTLLTSLDGLSGGSVVDGGAADASDAAIESSDGSKPACDPAVVSTDPHNCGRCGRDCLGGACAAGVCSAVTILESAGAHFWGLAIDDQNIVFTDNAGYDKPSRLARANLDGSGVRTLVPSNTAPTAVAVADSKVYFITQQDGQMHGTTVDGGAGPPLPGGNGVASGRCLIVGPDKLRLYYSSNAAIRTLVFGASPVTLVSGQAPEGLAVSDKSLFWTNDDGTMRTAQLDGSGVRTLASGQQGPRCMAIDGDDLYWANHDSGTIVRWSISRGVATKAATGEDQPISVAVDALSLWWTTTTKIRRLAK